MSTTTLLRVTLRLEDGQRFGVGGAFGDGASDPGSAGIRLPLYADPRSGAPVVPGTSLAGSLRTHVDRLAEAWLGPAPPERESQGDHLTPSWLWIRSATMDPADVGVRGRTAIDGQRGAAKGRSLRVEEAIDGVTSVAVAMEHDGPSDRDLVSALQSWRPVIGRGRSTGMGVAWVSHVEVVTVDRSIEDHLQWWLTERHDWYRDGGIPTNGPIGTYSRHPENEDDESPAATLPGYSVAMEMGLVTRDPLRVGTEKVPKKPARGGARNAQPAATMCTRDGHPIVPATTWKGIFRHRIEMILSLLEVPAADVEEISAELFGSPERGRGVLRFTDSVMPGARLRDYTHVAIDRFTGGARDEALFAVKAVVPDTPLLLRIEWLRPPEADTKTCADRLIRHVVADLADGLIGVGAQSWRGYGTVGLADSSNWVAPNALVVDELTAWAADLRSRAAAGEAQAPDREERSSGPSADSDSWAASDEVVLTDV